MAWLIGMAVTLLPTAPAIAPRRVEAPVTGRWSAVNSPASKTPSHGTNGLGQTYAIDLVYEPSDGARPKFGAGPAFRPPSDFPAFGQPLRSPVAGRVVSVRTGVRDHRSRSTWAAFAYMMLEGMVRELFGARFMIGNHIVIDAGEGVYAAVAHMQRGSASVRPGAIVNPGDPIGRCGNSGNSSEPHVHLQLMDNPRPFLAAGLPFEFADVSIDGSSPRNGVPANEKMMVAPELGPVQDAPAAASSDERSAPAKGWSRSGV